MAIPFQYHPIENFPLQPELGKQWDSIRQLILPEESIADDAHSEMKFVGISIYQDYFKYHVRHETLKDCWLRIDNEDRRRAIFVDEFEIFMPPNSSYILVKAPLKITLEMLQRIKVKNRDFQYKLREINLSELKTNLQAQVKGGWFRDLEIEDVSTAAIFGSNVSESDEWDRYTSYGKLSSLVIEFTHRGRKHSINLSSSGAITLYSAYEESDALELVEKFNNIAMKYQNEMDPKNRRDSKTTR